MPEANPIVPAKERDSIQEGVLVRLKRLRSSIEAFSSDLQELQRLEKLLIAASERLDRHTGLIGMETQLLDALLKRDVTRKLEGKASSAAQPVPLRNIVDKVEADLESMMAEGRSETK